MIARRPSLRGPVSRRAPGHAGSRGRQDALHAVRYPRQIAGAAGADIERAKRLLEKAESSCLVANSLNSERHLTVEVGIGRSDRPAGS